MKNQTQVTLELIERHVAEYQKLDVSKVYTERMKKAETLLIERHVQRQPDGTYLVQGSRPEPYHVNSTCECECEDAVRGNAPQGWCKHRIATKLFAKTLIDLENLQRHGVPHLHFTCTHRAMMELCWQVACQEPMDMLCETCALEISTPPDIALHETEDLDESQTALPQAQQHEEADTEKRNNDSWEQVIADESLNGDGPLPASMMSHAELAQVAAPTYEPCPTPTIKKVASQRPLAVAMPEAPASMNLKLKVGAVEIMYTARSMKRGSAGDTELDVRLPEILAMLERLAVAEQEHEVHAIATTSWLKRMVGWCRVPGTSTERY